MEQSKRTLRIAQLETEFSLLRKRNSTLREIVWFNLTAPQLRVDAQKELVSVDAELKTVEAELRRLQRETARA